MALTVELACTKSGMAWEKNPNSSYPNQASYSMSGLADDGEQRLYLGFEALPSNLRNYAITKAYIKIAVGTNYHAPNRGYLYYLANDFPANIKWTTRQEGRGVYRVDFVNDYDDGKKYFIAPDGSYGSYPVAKWATEPWFYVLVQYAGSWYDGPYEALASAAKLVIEYDSSITITSEVDASNAPKNRYVNPRNALTIPWTLKSSSSSYNSANSAKGFTQASAKVYWRAGSSGSYTEISVSGSTTSVTVPANTFPTGSTIQYYIQVTDTTGHTSQSSVFQFSTADSAISVTVLAPIGTVEDGSAVIVFRWNYSSPNGTTPTLFDLWWKKSTDASWTHVDSLPGTSTIYSMPAGTLPAGDILWTVRAYNADSVAGNWSATARFVCIAAPATPSVNSDAAPFATITWQVDDQQAWRLSVDGKNYGTHFGSGKSFTLPDYLEDGEHTATVEVQGQYGLWSQPGTATFTVSNTPGSSVVLEGAFGVDAGLNWLTESLTADFLIYRDGVRIGHTAGSSFTDRFVLGQHSWRVVNRLSNGNYTASNEVSGVLKSCVTRVAPIAGGDWLELPLSERSSSEQKFAYARRYSLRHMLGAELPVLELSSYVDGSGNYEAAFRSVPELQAFEALLGQVVIIKSRGGRVLIGALTDVTTHFANFYIAAEFTLQRCHWEDYIDDADA